jgi:hypothetical protein
MFSLRSWGLLLVAGAATLVSQPAATATPMFTLDIVAERGDTDPGSSGTFTSFGRPSIHSGNVAFQAFSTGGNDGVYRDVGSGVDVVADRSTVNPGPIGPANIMSSFRDPSVDAAGNTAWYSPISSSGTKGIFAHIGGTVQQAAVRDMPFPGLPSQILLNFDGDVQIENGLVTFDGTIGLSGSSGTSSIVRQTASTLERLAFAGQPMPGGTKNFNQFGFGNPVTENGITAFQGAGDFGSSQESGVFSDASGSLQPVAYSGITTIPGTATPFGFFDQTVALDRNGADVVFAGGPADFSSAGIYGFIGGSYVKLVDSSTSLPEGGGNFNLNGFLGSGFSYDNGNLLFVGSDSSFNPAVYAIYQGELLRIIGRNDSFDGETVSNLNISFVDQAISGNQFVVSLFFNSGRSAVVRGTFVPEPTTAALAVGMLLSLGFSVRRRCTCGKRAT